MVDGSRAEDVAGGLDAADAHLRGAPVLVEDCHRMWLVVDQHPVGAFLADSAHEPLGVAVRSGAAGRNPATDLADQKRSHTNLAVRPL